MTAHDTLTPYGARLLREVRDHITAHPETFDWATWCGTRCCFAGHLGRLLDIDPVCTTQIANAVGFLSSSPMQVLFYGWGSLEEMTDVAVAATRINEFLWQYGYPPEEVPGAPIQAERTERMIRC
jgi:hypothetical protein